MAPDGKKATANKRYYDVLTWLVTQLVFSFTTAPFILLNIHDSTLVWARVYFYAIIGVTACSLFLVTPGKAYLSKKVKARTGAGRPDALKRNESQESLYVSRFTPDDSRSPLTTPSNLGKERPWVSLLLLVIHSMRWSTRSLMRSSGGGALLLDQRALN